MEIFSIILFLFGFSLGSFTVWLLRQKEIDSIQKNQEQLKDVFGNLSNEALIQNNKNFMDVAESHISTLLNQSDKQLTNKKELIDLTLKEMKNDLKDLSENTVKLQMQLEESRKNVGELSDTTTQLRQILSSNQARGQWGEKLVEDILHYIGFKKGINYSQQTQSGSDRPDFTFYLPDNKSLNMDVKFPIKHYEKYLETNDSQEKEKAKIQFLRDVRERVKEVSKRGYIDPNGSTLDFVLLLIPNESIYAFLNKEDHKLIDFSLQQKIMLCSPITLYAILSLIRQAVKNWSLERKAGDLQSLVATFKKQWDEYVIQMEKFEGTLGTLNTHYQKLITTRKNQLDKPMENISKLQLGQDEAKKG